MLNKLRGVYLTIIEFIVFANFFIFLVWLIASLFGLFNFWVVLTTLILVLMSFYLITINKQLGGYFWFFIFLTAITGLGFALLRGFYIGDAYAFWLPAARDLVNHGTIPTFFGGQFFSRMPLFILYLGGHFALFRNFNEFLPIWIPIFFTASTLLIIYDWAKSKGVSRQILFFLPALFLINHSVSFWGSWNLLQESFILFFTTAFFYFYEKYRVSPSDKYLILFLISFVLTLASKISGVFIVPLMLYFFFRASDKKKFFWYGLLLSGPMIIWFARNYFIFDNPVFPVLNNIFGGRYATIQGSYAAWHGVTFSYFESFSSRFIFSLKSLWPTFPFLLLSFYALIKKRRYDYLIFIILFFIFKEVFLFTPTMSTSRYFYLFLGLLIVYALSGLNEIRSRLGLAFFITIALGGLLLTPVTDSSSFFISQVENRLYFLSNIFIQLHDYWHIVLIMLTPLIWQASREPDKAKMLLLVLYITYIIQLSFIVNKSWLNTWPFVIADLVLLVILAAKKDNRYFKVLAAGIIFFLWFVNSWGMAGVYYSRQGISLPVPHIWESSSWTSDILASKIEQAEKEEIYILTAAQPEFFKWWGEYQVINFLDADFWFLLKDYRPDLSADELHTLLVANRVKYVIKNESKIEWGTRANEEFVNLFAKIAESNRFIKIGEKDNIFFIWQVY